MRALLYLSKRSLINNLKKACRKPVSLVIIIFCVLYGVFLCSMLTDLVRTFQFDSPRGLVIIMTLWTLYMFFMNFMAYSSRKGIIFRPAHAHFVFTAPADPKLVLIHAAWMNYILGIAMDLLLFLAGIFIFHISAWRMLAFLIFCVTELVMELSLMVWLYSSERISERVLKTVCLCLKLFLLGITAVIILYFWRQGITLESINIFFDWPVLQMIPAAGWAVAAIRLIVLGPTVLNVVCTLLYLALTLTLFMLAWKMPCTGGYYEDAAKFADTYAEMVRRKKNGEMVFGLEEKKKFRKMRGNFRATGAKAIFYRQILEYRKERFFLFSKTTFFLVGLAVFLAFSLRESAESSQVPGLVLLGILAYFTLILSGNLGKWETEIKMPYLYLIPDSAVKKLWYSTLTEHIKALAEGMVISLVVGVVWKIPVLQILLCALIYAVLQANRMYTKVIAQCVIGNSLGKTGESIVRMCIQMFILGIGIAAAVLLVVLGETDLVFPIVLIYSMIITVAMGLIASIRFDSMEQMG